MCYVVPESSGRFNLQVQTVFDRLLNSVSLIHNFTDGHCNIILHLTDEYVFDISRPRFSQDKGHTNSNGTALLDFCK